MSAERLCPMTSAKCERVFSVAKDLIPSERNRLGDGLMEPETCLEYWEQDEDKDKDKDERGAEEEP